MLVPAAGLARRMFQTNFRFGITIVNFIGNDLGLIFDNRYSISAGYWSLLEIRTCLMSIPSLKVQ